MLRCRQGAQIIIVATPEKAIAMRQNNEPCSKQGQAWIQILRCQLLLPRRRSVYFCGSSFQVSAGAGRHASSVMSCPWPIISGHPDFYPTAQPIRCISLLPIRTHGDSHKHSWRLAQAAGLCSSTRLAKTTRHASRTPFTSC